MSIFRKSKLQLCVYIVDDNELDLKVLGQEFELRTNYDVKTFKSGDTFLKDLISNPPIKGSIVIIIIDYDLNAINLDAKNGIELLKTIKEINREYEVILISKESNVDMVTSALHFGAVNFVKKNENVYMRLQNNIKWIRSQRDLKKKRNIAIRMIILFGIVLIAAIFLTLFGIDYYQNLSE